jgi:hypothetical protein
MNRRFQTHTTLSPLSQLIEYLGEGHIGIHPLQQDLTPPRRQRRIGVHRRPGEVPFISDMPKRPLKEQMLGRIPVEDLHRAGPQRESVIFCFGIEWCLIPRQCAWMQAARTENDRQVNSTMPVDPSFPCQSICAKCSGTNGDSFIHSRTSTASSAVCMRTSSSALPSSKRNARTRSWHAIRASGSFLSCLELSTSTADSYMHARK